MIEVRKYKKEDKAIWDSFIDVSKNCTFLFKRDYMDYHQHRFEDYSLMVFENKVLIAVFPAHMVKKNTIASHLGLSYGGLVLNKAARLKESLIVIYQILSFLNSNSINKIIQKLFHRMYNSIASDEFEYAIFLLKAKLTSREIASVVNMEERLEFSKNRRRCIRKAVREGVEIKEVDTLDVFWNEILIPNLANKYQTKPIHSLSEITKLHHSFPKNIRQFNAYIGGIAIAGTTIFESNTTAKAQYNSASEMGRSKGASDLLYSQLINTYFNDKKYFDFGTSFDYQGLNFELLNWKESFGARPFTIDIYEIDTSNNYLLEKFINHENTSVTV